MPEAVALTDLIAQKAEAQAFKLPVFNTVALEVNRALSEHADMHSVEAIILKDSALASEILRVSNSAFFSGLAKIDTIQDALVRLGQERVKSLIMLAAQQQVFKAKHAYLKGMMQKLWVQAAATAGGARWLAQRYLGHDQAETAFLAGLFHDLGSLVLLKVLDEICQEQPDLPLTDAVMGELISSLHTDYGYRVMQAWELPLIYAEIAQNHHTQDNTDNGLLNVVILSDHCCHKVGIGCKPNDAIALDALPSAQRLGAKAVHLAELEIFMEDMQEQFG